MTMPNSHLLHSMLDNESIGPNDGQYHTICPRAFAAAYFHRI